MGQKIGQKMEIQYKGFVGKILYSAEADVFYGEILNFTPLLVFQASSLQGCQEAMYFAVEDYLRSRSAESLVS